MISGPANVTGVVVGATSQVVSAAKPRRRYLAIYNQDGSNRVYIAFDRPAVAAATAGQITLQPVQLGVGNPSEFSKIEWTGSGFVPGNQINLIASGVNTSVTVIE